MLNDDYEGVYHSEYNGHRVLRPEAKQPLLGAVAMLFGICLLVAMGAFAARNFGPQSRFSMDRLPESPEEAAWQLDHMTPEMAGVKTEPQLRAFIAAAEEWASGIPGDFDAWPEDKQQAWLKTHPGPSPLDFTQPLGPKNVITFEVQPQPYNPGGPLPPMDTIIAWRRAHGIAAEERWIRLDSGWVNVLSFSPKDRECVLDMWRDSHPWPVTVAGTP